MKIKPIGEEQARFIMGDEVSHTANANQSKLIEESKKEREKNAAKENYLKWYCRSTISVAQNLDIAVY